MTATPNHSEADQRGTEQRQGGRLGYTTPRRNLNHRHVSIRRFRRDARDPNGKVRDSPCALIRERSRRDSRVSRACVRKRSTADLREGTANGPLNKEVKTLSRLERADNCVQDLCGPAVDYRN